MEPQKFFIGVVEFFAVLLPGALLTYLVMGKVGPVVLGSRYGCLGESEGWAVFAFASYLLGHLVFLLGAWLDDFYDWVRGYTLNAQISRLARRGLLLPGWVRAVIWLIFKGERNLAVDRAGRIKRKALRPLDGQDAINTFQWSKIWLKAEGAEALAVVQRFEADSKFFRCFTVVLLILILGWPLQGRWPAFGLPVLVGLLLLALWRYMEQRHKATNQAYWSVITLAAERAEENLPASPSASARAGGVVFRSRDGVVEYLLVEAKEDPSQWVLPKGHVEAGEQPRETAVREVLEETGVWARVVEDLGAQSWSVEGRPVVTQFFLMEAVGRGLRKERARRHRWLPKEDAIACANFNETRELLREADSARTRPPDDPRARPKTRNDS